MKLIFFSVFLFSTLAVFSQSFERSELQAELNAPWEITFGPDGYLWLTESGGVVSRVHSETGIKEIIYSANDYFEGDASETFPFCHQPIILYGTLGLALHPDFLDPSSSFIYYVYSYNNGDASSPQTTFKIVRLKWNEATNTVVEVVDLITEIPSGHDHIGGRLLSTRQHGVDYLYLSIGDTGISEDSSPTCYDPPSLNPNNYTQVLDSMNGKIHRYLIDGSIPTDNPISGSSFFTRGHRNPQGLAYNSQKDILYCIEHGDQTDDEVNVLIHGMNYGWKHVRGYHFDDSYANEDAFVNNYVPDPQIPNDHLVEPIYSWCTDPSLNGTGYLEWCTVAPSDGEYYESNAIHQWKNSLLVTTLKDGDQVNREVYVLRLNDSGTELIPSTTEHPNPSKHFGQDQLLNGRLRDICFSPDGRKVYLVNNGGADRDKITVYTYDPTPELGNDPIRIFPNPSKNEVSFLSNELIVKVVLHDQTGRKVIETESDDLTVISIEHLRSGIYTAQIVFQSGESVQEKIVKQ